MSKYLKTEYCCDQPANRGEMVCCKSQFENNVQRGFTLIELLIVVLIGSILAAIATPSFNSYINSTGQTSAIMQLVSDLNRAKSEAIKRNSRVYVCARNTAGDDCSGSTDWAAGWLVCADNDSDGTCDDTTDVNPNPVILRSALKTTITLTGPAAGVRFNPNGSQGTGAASSLTFLGTWADATPRVVTIAMTGNISK